MEIYVKKFFYFIFSFFLLFKHDFIECVDFETHITASNGASDDVTNYVTRRIFNTYLSYSFAHFVVEIGEKLSHSSKF